MTDHALLSRLDLNLLVSLDALLTERSVTRAAERLHLSQPALSASLARLRTHFNDPILARRGNTYELTPFALRLAEHTTTALDAARRVFESQATWEPSESAREFLIYGSDYGFTTIGRVVSELAAERAPRRALQIRAAQSPHRRRRRESAACGGRHGDPARHPHRAALRRSVARPLGGDRR
ncbi:LysR family transcriptional regulator [Microbacterium yannicii]|uniref:LysR family transcriptional regulator n=1 Tax=Microbacterium yannicii TaxID=671622 RepID=UPI0032AF2F11